MLPENTYNSYKNKTKKKANKMVSRVPMILRVVLAIVFLPYVYYRGRHQNPFSSVSVCNLKIPGKSALNIIGLVWFSFSSQFTPVTEVDKGSLRAKVNWWDLGSKQVSDKDFVANHHNFAREFLWQLRNPLSTNVDSLCYFEFCVLKYKLCFVFWALI